MNNDRFPISVVILTNRSDEHFLRALDSVQWADEILIIDDHSPNKWDYLSNKYHFSLLKCEKITNFAKIRNELLTKAKNEWVLFLDSDEILTDDLMIEIQQILPKTNYSAFYLRRKDIFLGKILQHGEVGNIKLLRLVSKNSGLWQGKVHEKFVLQKGENSDLNYSILHYPHSSIHSFISKINHYTTLRAIELSEQNTGFSIWEMLAKPIIKFIWNYFFKLGFLDGWRGLIYAMTMSLHSLLVRIKLYEDKLD